MKILNCRWNNITSLPDLPLSITDLNVGDNLLTKLPKIPPNIESINIRYNNFLWNISQIYMSDNLMSWKNNDWNEKNKYAWSNYRILCKIQRSFHKRKRRRYYLNCKDIITNDISSLVVRYL